MTTRGRKRHRPEQIIAKLRDEEESKRRHPQFVAEPKTQTPTNCSRSDGATSDAVVA